jgi:hypothetical protein
MNQDLSNAQHILARAGQEKLMLLSMSHVSVENFLYCTRVSGR